MAIDRKQLNTSESNVSDILTTGITSFLKVLLYDLSKLQMLVFADLGTFTLQIISFERAAYTA